MASDLEKSIHEFKTPFLLEQFYGKRSEYSAEAVAIMEKEIASRRIPAEDLKKAQEAAVEEAPVGDDGKPVTFVPFDHTFSQTDMLLVNAILHDATIPFYVERPATAAMVPLEGDSDLRYTIQVAQDSAEKAHELLNEHFHREDGRYHLRHTDARDRLRAFSFTEVRMTEPQLAEIIEAELTAQERETITTLGKRLLGDIDNLEKQDRVVFYFDNVEEVLSSLRSSGQASMSVLDLLTIVEILQIYCDEPQFPPSMFQSAAALLDLFEK